MDTNKPGIGLQETFVLRTGQAAVLPKGDVCVGGDGTNSYVYPVEYCPVTADATCDKDQDYIISQYDIVSKLKTVNAWLAQFPENIRDVYLAGVAGNSCVAGNIAPGPSSILSAITNAELNCVLNNCNCYVCQSAQGASTGPNNPNCAYGGKCACTTCINGTTKLDPKLVALAGKLLVLRRAQEAPIHRPQQFGSESGCQNLTALEWAARTGLPNATSLTPQCHLKGPALQVCDDLVKQDFGGSSQEACNLLSNPLDTDTYAANACNTMVGFNCLDETGKPDCGPLTAASDPYCSCVRETKLATLNAQGAAARCCYEAPVAPAPPKKKSSKWWIYVIIGVVVLIIVITVPVVLHKKKESKGIQGREGLPIFGRGSNSSHSFEPYAAPEITGSGPASDGTHDIPFDSTLPSLPQ